MFMVKKISFNVLLSGFLLIIGLPVRLLAMDAADKTGKKSHVKTLGDLEQKQNEITNRMLRNFRVIAYCEHKHKDYQIYKNEGAIKAISLKNSKNEQNIATFLRGVDRPTDQRVLALKKIQKNINENLRKLKEIDVHAVHGVRAVQICWCAEEMIFNFRKNDRSLTEKLNRCSHVYRGTTVPMATIRHAKHCPLCDSSDSLDEYDRPLCVPVSNKGNTFATFSRIVFGVACVGLLVYAVSKFFG